MPTSTTAAKEHLTEIEMVALQLRQIVPLPESAMEDKEELRNAWINGIVENGENDLAIDFQCVLKKPNLLEKPASNRWLSMEDINLIFQEYKESKRILSTHF